MGFHLRAGQLLLGAAMVGVASPSCYSAGAGTDPPPNSFYYPVGLAVSEDGKVLYAVNSDLDLQFNGGTLQSYNLGVDGVDAKGAPLRKLRDDAALLIQANISTDPSQSVLPSDFPFIPPSLWKPGCLHQPPVGGTPLGQSCAAPPVDSTRYVQDSAIIGAFATQLQVSVAPEPDGRRRLFAPVRGDTALTWANIGDPAHPFLIDCGTRVDNRCSADHEAGSDPNQPGNTRQVTMPGEPFGMAQTEDGTAVAITHQSDTETSLLKTGLSFSTSAPASDPTMQFVLNGPPVGGVGIVAVPHDPDAPVKPCEDVTPIDTPPCVRPAFLETFRTTAEIDLLRYYDDDLSSPEQRPYLTRDAVFPITSNAIGTDSRGIAIDPTPRIWCKAQGGDPAACAQLGARVFFAGRTPTALGIGEIGGSPPPGGSYDPDRLVYKGNVPLPPGPSNVYLAPIIDPAGNFALRVFVICFDASQIVVYDPDQEATEKIINVGPGPFAMAFDPFSIEDVGRRAMAQSPDQRGNRPYRFAYVASFTQSFVQMIDLDNSQPTAETFERVVFTLGLPTNPKGR